MTDLFDGQTPDPDKAEQTPNTPEALLATIKNEEGVQKYATVDKALEALNASQTYIPQLKDENSKLQAELEALKAQQAKSENVEDVVDKLLKAREEAQPKADPQTASLSEEQVANIVRAEQEKIAKNAAAQANRDVVSQSLTNTFGDKAQEEIAKKAAELGTTVEKIGELAAESPQMVIQLFSQGGTPAPSHVPSSTVNTAQLKNQEVTLENIPRPEKSLLSGATAEDQEAFMRQIKAAVYKKYDVTA